MTVFSRLYLKMNNEMMYLMLFLISFDVAFGKRNLIKSNVSLQNILAQILNFGMIANTFIEGNVSVGTQFNTISESVAY